MINDVEGRNFVFNISKFNILEQTYKLIFADRLFFDQIEAELMEDETLQKQTKVNRLDTFKIAFDDNFIDVLISRVEQISQIVDKILTNKAFGDWVKDFYMKRAYSRLNQ